MTKTKRIRKGFKMSDTVSKIRNATLAELDELSELIDATIAELVEKISSLEALAKRAKRAKKARSHALCEIAEDFAVNANEIWESLAEFRYGIDETKLSIKEDGDEMA